ncbi:rhodanese family protein [uncultured Brevundimonas sp.]|uniref:rhodanese family protein n=1 Tax=uncultured Brevundimonas sp. TaxID=213418 RepID=UPI0030EB281C|tara:strand:- start:128 stop:664 length:537 start_codon:yes stop_codon:yes gene_type:complete
MTVLTALSAADVAARMKSGTAVLVDIRERDEFAREHIPGAAATPMSLFEKADLQILPGRDVVFMCRSGNRTQANCNQLASRVPGQAYVLAGGIDGWKKAGLATKTNDKAPLEMMRQVQMVAGGLILTGAALGVLVHPAFWGLAAFVGAGLFFAGATGFCGMARLLAVMPWNRNAFPAA